MNRNYLDGRPQYLIIHSEPQFQKIDIFFHQHLNMIFDICILCEGSSTFFLGEILSADVCRGLRSGQHMGNCSRRQDTQQQEAGALRQLLMLFSAKANREMAGKTISGGLQQSVQIFPQKIIASRLSFHRFWTTPTNGFGGFLSLEKNPLSLG